MKAFLSDTHTKQFLFRKSQACTLHGHFTRPRLHPVCKETKNYMDTATGIKADISQCSAERPTFAPTGR